MNIIRRINYRLEEMKSHYEKNLRRTQDEYCKEFRIDIKGKVKSKINIITTKEQRKKSKELQEEIQGWQTRMSVIEDVQENIFREITQHIT